MDVSAYLERRLELEEDGLREEDLARLEAQTPDLVLRQLDILAGPRSTNCKNVKGLICENTVWSSGGKARVRDELPISFTLDCATATLPV